MAQVLLGTSTILAFVMDKWDWSQKMTYSTLHDPCSIIRVKKLLEHQYLSKYSTLYLL